MAQCPNCLGTGQVPQVIKVAPHVRRLDIAHEYPLVTCLVCHGTGIRPAWMNDERHRGKAEGDPTWKVL